MNAALSTEWQVPAGGEPRARGIRVPVIGGSSLLRSTIGVSIDGARDIEFDGLGLLRFREAGVVKLVATGLDNKTIAARLSVRDSTVRDHLTSVHVKVGVPDRRALVVFAFRHVCSPPA